MPPSLVKTPLQEQRWQRAKEIVREQTGKPQSQWGDREYGLTVHIMQNMRWYPDEPPKRRKKRSAECSTHPGIPESEMPRQNSENWRGEGCEHYDDSHDVCLDKYPDLVKKLQANIPAWKLSFEKFVQLSRKCK